MIKQLKYQEKAVGELVDKTINLINQSGDRKRIVFKAPTGSGKTVMASEMLDRLTTELQDSATSHVREVAVIWIAPNKLHQQSYMKMRNFFTETRVLQPVMYDELDHSADGYIHPTQVLFVNWESINKEKNVMVRESEQTASLYDICRRTKEHGLPIVVVIDEEHMFAGRAAVQSEKVLKRINPKVEIRISATPNAQKMNALVEVPREDVIREQMIKEGIVVNPTIDVNQAAGSLTELLIDHAMAKRNEIATAYKDLGVNINPLLLIQLPNDNSEKMNVDEQTIAEEVKAVLNQNYGINTDNGKLGVWLSGVRENVTGIEREDSIAEALLFKQAIALGWDCPRAAVLLIFRKMESFQFTMQTVGRILRMPEQRHYTNPLLNKGYVYTDLSKDKIQIVADDMNYISQDIVAVRRSMMMNVSLTSVYSEYRSSDRNRLNPDFKGYLQEAFKRLTGSAAQLSLQFDPFEDKETEEDKTQHDLFGDTDKLRKAAEQQGVNFNVRNIMVEIPTDVYVDDLDERQTIELENTHKLKYARTVAEMTRVFDDFLSKLLTKFERKHSLGVLKCYLLDYMEAAFGLMDADAMKVILYKANRNKFEEVIQNALNRYARDVEQRKKQAKQRALKKYQWEVPDERYYNSQTNSAVKDVKNHALMPFVRLNTASNPERNFEQFLEENKDYIDWWYKNGDDGKQHYAVPYEVKEGATALFYPDFVIRMKNGQVFIFDTKSIGSDLFAAAKHNALLAYMNSEENKPLNLKGGILLQEGDLWRYSQFRIENTTDLNGWTAFHPDQYK